LSSAGSGYPDRNIKESGKLNPAGISEQAGEAFGVRKRSECGASAFSWGIESRDVGKDMGNRLPDQIP